MGCILAGWNAPLPLWPGGLCQQAKLKINRNILRTGRQCRQRDRELVRYASRYNLKKLEEEVWGSVGHRTHHNPSYPPNLMFRKRENKPVREWASWY